VKNLEPGESTGTKAICNPGEQVISGGADWGHEDGVNAFVEGTWLMNSSANLSENGWWAGGHNGTPVDIDLRVRAYCLS
jgi:hypothetical protein